MALQYYDRALQTDPKYPDALLGRAKIHFVREEYFKCVVQINPLSRRAITKGITLLLRRVGIQVEGLRHRP